MNFGVALASAPWVGADGQASHAGQNATRAGDGAYGGSGISHSLANTHLVIAAIYNAIGKWVDPPATPDRVLMALGKA